MTNTIIFYVKVYFRVSLYLSRLRSDKLRSEFDPVATFTLELCKGNLTIFLHRLCNFGLLIRFSPVKT